MTVNKDGSNTHTLLLFSSLFLIKKKVLDRLNFRLPVFNGFTCFGMPCTRFHDFYKMSVCVYVTSTFQLCQTGGRNWMKCYTQLHLNIGWCGGVPSLGAFLRDSRTYLREFRRKPRKTLSSQVDKRDRGLNLAPPVYQL